MENGANDWVEFTINWCSTPVANDEAIRRCLVGVSSYNNGLIVKEVGIIILYWSFSLTFFFSFSFSSFSFFSFFFFFFSSSSSLLFCLFSFIFLSFFFFSCAWYTFYPILYRKGNVECRVVWFVLSKKTASLTKQQ